MVSKGIIYKNLERLKRKIEEVALKSKRDSQGIKLVAVTKTATIEQIREAIKAGIKIIGENKVQEAQKKFPQIDSLVEWHMVGHLQTNKVKYAVEIFNLIHSVDSIKLAQEIDKRSRQFNKITDILVEVNVSGELSKYGIKPEEVESFLREISVLPWIRVQGLMTIAPIVKNKEEVRPYFRKLRELSNQVKELRIKNIEMKYLSMGMTDDFEIAIEEGANMLRIGRAIFGVS